MSGPLQRFGAPLVGLLLVGACLAQKDYDGCGCGAGTSSGESTYTAISFPTPSTEPEESAEAPEAEEPGPLPDFADPAWTQVDSRAGTYRVCWRAIEGEVSRNEDFTLEAWVLRDGNPIEDGYLSVHAWMPDHGHGMLRKPRVEKLPDGSFRIAGMLLHMRGHWQLFFEVLQGTLSETTECDLNL